MRSGKGSGIATLLGVTLAALVGCTGKSNNTPSPFTIGGTVSGLSGSGLVLQNNGGSNLSLSAGASSFTFQTATSSASPYSITVLTQPAGEVCTVSNGSGVATTSVTSVSVACSAVFTVGGSVTGLTASGLALQNNGGNTLQISAGMTSYTFPTISPTASTYDVTVLTQPFGENCTVTNASGKLTSNVTGANVVCTQGEAIAGTISGLSRAGLVLQDNNGDNLAVPVGATSFAFPNEIAMGGPYSVTVLLQPAAENCIVSNGSGTASGNVVNVTILCLGDWAWTGGDSSVGFNGGPSGDYGVLGMPSSTNFPGSRKQAATWTDASGVVWLFGGYGPDVAGTGGELNNLWKFDPKLGTSGQWTWVSGSQVNPLAISFQFPNGEPGVYGTLGTPSPGNAPGGREQLVTWKDHLGNLWLFGGTGIDSVGVRGYLNDVWKFTPDPSGVAGEWTWMSGSNTSDQSGVYGTLGTASTANTPGGRFGAVHWVDASGNLWLFGGTGLDSAGTIGYLNDLWKYTPGDGGAAGQWTWMGGSNTVPPSNYPGDDQGQPGTFGTEGVADTANIPSGRATSAGWTDAQGDFWLLGGFGADSTGANGYLNDFWRFDPNTGAWTWMGGSATLGMNGGQSGVYGVLGAGDATNVPGARFSPVSWTDTAGNLWLFGGQGYDWTGAQGDLNDLWRYAPSPDGTPGLWTWMGGSNAVGPQGGQPGVYGTLGSPAAANAPGSRLGAVSWTDPAGNLVLFGGNGYDITGSQGYLNDLWIYQP